jgi:uroporphyrin-3 C-methyltransferase
MEKQMTDKNKADKQSPNKTEQDDSSKTTQGPSASITVSAPTSTKKDNKASSASSANPSTKDTKSDVKNEKNSTMNKASNPRSKTSASIVQAKISKTAVFSLVISFIASAGVAGLFYWDIEQQAITKQTILQQTQQSLVSSEQQIKQLLTEQQSLFAQQLEQTINQVKQESQSKIAQLESSVTRLSQNQPSDWLIHEAQYLIRIATRTMWLEHDITAAVGLLRDADERLKELNDPEYLPIRQLIREDITALKLMPKLDSESVIMTLIAMNKQVKNLPLAMVKVPDDGEENQDFTLSNNPDDWQSNLAKTWQKFLADFITVRRRGGSVEPLMSPQYQQNLRENLSLKLQQTQWATRDQEQKVYDQTLEDIQQWLNEYFDMTLIENQHFYQGIQNLKSEIISYDYPSSLLSLKAIRKVLADKPLKPLLDKLEQQNKLIVPIESGEQEIHAIPDALPENNLQPGGGQPPIEKPTQALDNTSEDA